MLWKVIDRLVIVVLGTEDPTSREWESYLREVERHGIDRTMQFVVTEGGAPSAMQRGHLSALLAGRSVPVAVVSGSVTIRAVVAAMSWFNHGLRGFPPTGLRDAIAYLEIPASRMELIEREVEVLRLSLSRGGEGST